MADESIKDLMASGAVVPDRPGSKRLVPAAQSVVVPVEPTEAMLKAGRLDGVFANSAANAVYQAMLAAAPAPSSLAGGEVSDGGYDRSDVRYGLHLIANEDCDEVAASYYAKKALAHLAALSPEAPAREGYARHGVYVASRASAPERPAMWRRLRDAGHPIISTWIDEAGEGESHDLGDLWGRILREVTSAERLILYAEAEDFPLKGAYVEVGMALAAGVPVYVVTPGVALDARSLRPLGSWAKHPLVQFCATVEEAFAALTPRHEAPFFIKDGEDPAEFCALGKRMADTDHEAPAREPDGMTEDERRRWLAGRSDWREDEWQDHCGRQGCEECRGEIPMTRPRAALTPRHEAPAEGMRAALVEIASRPLLDEPVSADGHRNRCPSCGHAWNIHKTPHHAPTCDRMTAIAALNEAPVEGAGEREAIARIMDPKGWETRDRQYDAIKRSTMHDKDRPLAFANADYYTRDSLTKADAIIALRARSSAPEAPAREGVIELAKRVTRDLSARHGADAPETNGARMVLAALICLPDALTPRHEAPASEGDAS